MTNDNDLVFIPFEQQRLDTLYHYQILDTVPSSEFDSLTRLAAGIAKAPIAFVSFVDRERQWFKSIIGLDLQETARSLSFCAHTVDSKDILVVEDAALDPRFADNSLVTGPESLRFYAGVSLITPGGHAIGTLAVLDRVPRQLSDDAIAGLRILAEEVMVHVELHREHHAAREAENERREVQRRLTVLMQNLPGMAYQCRLDAHWTMEFVSDGVEQLTGYCAADILGNAKLSYADLILAEDRPAVIQEVEDAVRIHGQFKLTYRIRHANGHIRWVWEQGVAVAGPAGKVAALEGFITDITAQKEAERQLAESEERWRFAVEGAGAGIWDQNLPENRVYLSRRCKEMLGFNDSEIGTDLNQWTHLVHPDDLPQLIEAKKRLVRGEDMISTDERRRHKDGSWRLIHKRGMVVSRDAEGRPIRMIGTYTDVTEARKQEKTLLHQAKSDPLTGLPNRRAFLECMRDQVAKASELTTLCAVLFIDLDGFKGINDTLGHEQGDRLLVRVAQRLSNCVRETDTVARLGGDEFTVILVNPQNEEIVHKIAQTIVQNLAEPYRMHGEMAAVSASIGIAVYPHDSMTVNELLQSADQAMYRAKQNGKNRFSR